MHLLLHIPVYCLKLFPLWIVQPNNAGMLSCISETFRASVQPNQQHEGYSTILR